MKKKNICRQYMMLLYLLLALALGGCSAQNVPQPAQGRQAGGADVEDSQDAQNLPESAAMDDSALADIPPYGGELYVELSGNRPSFSKEDITTEPFEIYSEQDELGRCGMAYANICKELMPTEQRGEIGMIKPTGWHTVKYDSVDGKYLYNRCHLIAFMLAGENDNEKNLITGTRYFNVEGMLPFENMVADYVEENDGHVLYRVTPVYQGENLVASGVKMEAYSVEDEGAGICFCVYVYNVQPGIEIDYATGESWIAGEESDPGYTAQPEAASDSEENQNDTDHAVQPDAEVNTDGETRQYVLNQNTHKFHTPDCSSVADIKPQNRADYEGSRQELMEQGYEPCGRCKP